MNKETCPLCDMPMRLFIGDWKCDHCGLDVSSALLRKICHMKDVLEAQNDVVKAYRAEIAFLDMKGILPNEEDHRDYFMLSSRRGTAEMHLDKLDRNQLMKLFRDLVIAIADCGWLPVALFIDPIWAFAYIAVWCAIRF